jgi:hypothetical protein
MNPPALRPIVFCWLALVSFGLGDQSSAKETQTAAAAATPEAPAPGPGSSMLETEEATRREEEFRKLVTNRKLIGHFTMDGQEDAAKLQTEEYVITGAMKLGDGELWALTSRIKYGKVDLTVPVPVQVKWAGDTPVITLDKVGIPGLGTFSARVVLDQDRYAGTWSHDQVGGHLFGKITPAKKERAEQAPARNPAQSDPEPAAKPGIGPQEQTGPSAEPKP